MSRPKQGLSRGQRGRAADRPDFQVAKAARCLGMALLGSLIGGAPDPAEAASRAERRCGPVCQERRARALPDQSAAFAQSARQAAATVTSAIALLQPVRTLTVTTATDAIDPGDGKLSLREAVGRANATAEVERIDFARALEGQTLVLAGGELVVDEDLVIDGDRDDDGRRVTLSGGNRSRVLHVAGSETDLVLTNLTLAHGFNNVDPNGAGIFLQGGSLALLDSTVRDCRIERAGYEFRPYGSGISASSGSRLNIVRSEVADNEAGRYSDGGGIFLDYGTLHIEDSIVSGNWAYMGGGVFSRGITRIVRSTISDNGAFYGGGVSAGGSLLVVDSTIAGNDAAQYGGGIEAGGHISLHGVTITGNYAENGGGGIQGGGFIEFSNVIVAGNRSYYNPSVASEIYSFTGFRIASNGHNLFGTDIAGIGEGDRTSVPASVIFADTDPRTGGGKLSTKGIVPLKRSLANPALSGGDPLAAGRTDQLGRKRPQPSGSLPDIGAVEIDQPLSTGTSVRNDVIVGNAAPNTLAGWAGNDMIRALGADDVVNAGPGSDLLDGGRGNNRLNGATGIDTVTFAFSTVAAAIDLTTGIARRGGETDRLASIEGAIGSPNGDRFTGNEQGNWFQGGLGRDLATGGAGRDTYDFDRVRESPPGSARHDVIHDFVPGEDVLDVTGIDADPAAPGDQAFRWVGTAPLMGVGQLGYVLSGGNTIVRASTDGDPAPELEIQLTGRRTLTEGDVRR